MSSSLHWRKVSADPDNNLSYEMKRAFSKAFLGHDGSLTAEPVHLGLEHAAFFKGIIAEGAADACGEGALVCDARLLLRLMEENYQGGIELYFRI